MDEYLEDDTVQKLKFSIKDFFSKCDQIQSFVGFGSISWGSVHCAQFA